MARYIGKRYDPKKIWERNSEFRESSQAVYFMAVRAFEVPSLQGKTFAIHRDSDLLPGLIGLLQRTLLGIGWDVPKDPTPAFRKYFFLDTTVAAPEDTSTHQPMALAITGSLVSMNGLTDQDSWRRDVRRQMDQGLRGGSFEPGGPLKLDRMDWEIVAEMVLRIDSATYANVLSPKVSGGYYF
jgi:hypothetical protein